MFNGVFVFPSNRMFKKNYVTVKNIQQNYGYSKFIVVSTPRGILTGRECVLFRVGGRALFYFY
jgi:ribosomal protein S8